MIDDFQQLGTEVRFYHCTNILDKYESMFNV